jgi:5,5'-dehydrodivanillate O-demethylase
MLTEAENKFFTEVSAGTPMGEYLRRHWHPIAPIAELDERPTKPVRLLGENLVLYRDRSGTYGLLDRLCPHRRVDLSYGIPEKAGLRCMYHGWMFDETGQCIEQPFEETVHPDGRFKEKVTMTGYPVEAKAGLLWAYLGPAPAPLVPNWSPFTHGDGFVDICVTVLPCNWFQAQENSIDPVHVEWLHAYWAQQLSIDTIFGKPPSHLKIGADPFDYGMIYRRVVEGSSEDDENWLKGRVCLFPYALFIGHTYACHFEWRVPIDDEHTLSIMWFLNRVAPGNEPPVQSSIPYWYGEVYDEDGRFRTSHVVNQDIVAWAGQGSIADRTKETLGESDRGVIMLRRMLKEQAALVAQGKDPMCVVRDPSLNKSLYLPVHDFFGTIAVGPGADNTAHIPFQHGEPDDAVAAINAVIATWKDAKPEG